MCGQEADSKPAGLYAGVIEHFLPAILYDGICLAVM